MQSETVFDQVKRVISTTGAGATELRQQFPDVPPNTIYKYRRQIVAELIAAGTPPPTPTNQPEATKGFRAFSDQKPISPRHVRVGALLSSARFRIGSLSATELVARYPRLVSAIRLRQMELGFHDFTLTELELVAQITGKTLTQLMEEFHVAARKPDQHFASVS